MIKKIEIPEILKISYIKDNEDYWKINLIPYYDYINLGRYIVSSITDIGNIPDSFIYNLLYWTEYLYIKGAIGELPVASSFYRMPDFTVQESELEAVGMQAKLSSVIWDSPQDGIYVPSGHSIGHIMQLGNIPTEMLGSAGRKVIMQELFYSKDTVEVKELIPFVKSPKFRLYKDILDFMSSVFSALVVNYGKCKTESELYSAITRNVAWEPAYDTVKDYKISNDIIYHYCNPDTPLYTFEWILQNTKPKARDYEDVYPFSDFAHAQAVYVSRAQYTSVFKLEPEMVQPDRKLWTAIARKESKDNLVTFALGKSNKETEKPVPPLNDAFDPFEEQVPASADKKDFDPFCEDKSGRQDTFNPFEDNEDLIPFDEQEQARENESAVLKHNLSESEEMLADEYLWSGDIFEKPVKRIAKTDIINKTAYEFIEDPFAEQPQKKK